MTICLNFSFMTLVHTCLNSQVGEKYLEDFGMIRRRLGQPHGYVPHTLFMNLRTEETDRPTKLAQFWYAQKGRGIKRNTSCLIQNGMDMERIVPMIHFLFACFWFVNMVFPSSWWLFFHSLSFFTFFLLFIFFLSF